MGRGHAPLRHAERGMTRQGGVYAPPCRIETAKMQRGGAYPSLLHWEDEKTYHIGGGHDSPSPALIILPIAHFPSCCLSCGMVVVAWMRMVVVVVRVACHCCQAVAIVVAVGSCCCLSDVVGDQVGDHAVTHIVRFHKR